MAAKRATKKNFNLSMMMLVVLYPGVCLPFPADSRSLVLGLLLSLRSIHDFLFTVLPLPSWPHSFPPSPKTSGLLLPRLSG